MFLVPPDGTSGTVGEEQVLPWLRRSSHTRQRGELSGTDDQARFLHSPTR